MADILILGSNSFSGSHFVNYCLAKEMDVIGISRSDEPDSSFLPYKWQNHPGKFSFYVKDLNHHLEDIIRIIKKFKPRYIINFAAQGMVAQSWQAPEQWFNTNTVSAVKLHDQLRQFDFIDRFIQVSTPEVYGTCEGLVTENRNYLPSTPYAVSKAAVDMSLHTFFQSYDFPVLYTRSANVYGPGQQLYRIIPRTVLSLKKREKLPLHGGGVSLRNFIHISDVVEATWQIMTRGTIGDIYHISSDSMLSIRELVEKICQQMDCDFEKSVDIVEERLGKDAAYHLSSTKLQTELDWKSTITLEQGIEQTVEWVEHHYEFLKKLPMDYQHKA